MRRTHYTVLLVCEGHAEHELARLVRDIFLPRNCGTVLQHRNAGGYGASRALDLALELRGQTAHDAYAILVDTDQHWSDDDRNRALAAGVVAIENSPCLEATLLLVDGKKAHRQTRDNKSAFEAAFGGPAHRRGVLQRHFPRGKLEDARKRVRAIDDFLQLIRC